MKKTIGLITTFAVCHFAGFALNLGAETNGQPTRTAAPLTPLKWIKGPKVVDLNQMAHLSLPEGFVFIGAEGARRVLEEMGNPTSGREVALIAPASASWFIVAEFWDSGYVHRTRGSIIDEDAVLAALRRINDEAQAKRQNLQDPPLTIVGWEQPPSIKVESLEWATRGEVGGQPVFSHHIARLGRSGYVEFSLVDRHRLSSTVTTLSKIVDGFSFIPGERYTDLQVGDKQASHTIAEVVTGGAPLFDFSSVTAAEMAKNKRPDYRYAWLSIIPAGFLAAIAMVWRRRSRSSRKKRAASHRFPVSQSVEVTDTTLIERQAKASEVPLSAEERLTRRVDTSRYMCALSKQVYQEW